MKHQVTAVIEVEVEGENMTPEELAEVCAPIEFDAALYRALEAGLTITDYVRSKDLGWTPDGNRAAYITEIEVLSVGP